jgi:transposase
MPSQPAHSPIAATDASALTSPQLVELVSKQEREIANLRRQVAWFQRQIFGQKSERRLPEPEGVQGTLGESFAVVPDAAPPNSKSKIAAHERAHKPKRPADGADESTLFFDHTKVPIEVIAVPNPEMEGLAPEDYEVIGEKVSHRLAQRPGSYVILKYVRPLIKRRDTQELSCPPAPAGVICAGSVGAVAARRQRAADRWLLRLRTIREEDGTDACAVLGARAPRGV